MNTALNPMAAARRISATPSSTSSSDTCAVHCSRGDLLWISAMAYSFETFMAARSNAGSRNDEFHMPREGKTSSAQMPSSSLSRRRCATSWAPLGRFDASMKAVRLGLGSFRRISSPSMKTVSYCPSGSLTERGIRSASAGGSVLRHRSSGSSQCESAELAHIFAVTAIPVPPTSICKYHLHTCGHSPRAESPIGGRWGRTSMAAQERNDTQRWARHSSRHEAGRTQESR